MTDNVRAWPNPTGRPMPIPRTITRPCDYGLMLTVDSLETQLGTIEAYNRLVKAAEQLRDRIDAGDSKPQNPLFAKSIKG